jgi:hypothetical protein
MRGQNLEGSGRGQILRYYQGIRLDGVRKPTLPTKTIPIHHHSLVTLLLADAI